MRFNLYNDSLISCIMALSLSKYGFEINIRNKHIKPFGRYFSINYFSKRYLENINIWENLELDKITQYKRIEIYKNNLRTICFNSKDINIDCLGYIINENDLTNAVSKLILKDKNIKCTSGTFRDSNSDTNIISSYQDVHPNIQSKNYLTKNYNQTAININIVHKISNDNIPRQIFYKNEILGFLPISEKSYNLIWSVPNELFNKISLEDSHSYIKLIKARANFILGDIKEISIGNSFSLSARHADEYFYKNTLLIGEAAHKFHPLAGLGLNMGIEDISFFTQLLTKHNDIKLAFREYAIKRIQKNNSLQHILDLIIQFHSSPLMSDKLKKYFLSLFDNTLLIKPLIIKGATGFDNKI